MLNPFRSYQSSYFEHENRRLLHVISSLQQQNFELVQAQHTLRQENLELRDENERLRTYSQTQLPEPTIDKSNSKLLASIPDPLTTNPIAALINFCKHYLKIELDFRHEVTLEHYHCVTVWLQNQPVSTCTDIRKKRAREQAAKQAIQYLNEYPQFVLRVRPEQIN